MTKIFQSLVLAAALALSGAAAASVDDVTRAQALVEQIKTLPGVSASTESTPAGDDVKRLEIDMPADCGVEFYEDFLYQVGRYVVATGDDGRNSTVEILFSDNRPHKKEFFELSDRASMLIIAQYDAETPAGKIRVIVTPNS